MGATQRIPLRLGRGVQAVFDNLEAVAPPPMLSTPIALSPVSTALLEERSDPEATVLGTSKGVTLGSLL